MAQTLAKQMSQPYKRCVLALLLVSFTACSINAQAPANSSARIQVALPRTKVETLVASGNVSRPSIAQHAFSDLHRV
jgi:hypothetical protein